jgi:hypothetical protein
VSAGRVTRAEFTALRRRADDLDEKIALVLERMAVLELELMMLRPAEGETVTEAVERYVRCHQLDD